MTDPDITIHIKLSPGEDIDSIASWLYDILSECTNEISDIEVEHI
jgi:hypothetical protein